MGRSHGRRVPVQEAVNSVEVANLGEVTRVNQRVNDLSEYVRQMKMETMEKLEAVDELLKNLQKVFMFLDFAKLNSCIEENLKGGRMMLKLEELLPAFVACSSGCEEGMRGVEDSLRDGCGGDIHDAEEEQDAARQGFDGVVPGSGVVPLSAGDDWQDAAGQGSIDSRDAVRPGVSHSAEHSEVAPCSAIASRADEDFEVLQAQFDEPNDIDGDDGVVACIGSSSACDGTSEFAVPHDNDKSNESGKTIISNDAQIKFATQMIVEQYFKDNPSVDARVYGKEMKEMIENQMLEQFGAWTLPT